MFLIEDIEQRKTKAKGNTFSRAHRGIFATADIPAGTVVSDYIGIMIRAEDENEQRDGLYCMYWSEDATIQANPDEMGAHLVNHSCTPNLGMFTYKRHTLYFAMRKIFKGEELTIHYAIVGPDEDCNPCTHACVCESPMCSGTFHLTAKIYTAWDAQIAKELGDTPEASPVPFGEYLPHLDKYPKGVSDRPVYPLYGSLKKSPLPFYARKIPTTREARARIRETGRMISLPTQECIIEGVINHRLIIRTQKK